MVTSILMLSMMLSSDPRHAPNIVPSGMGFSPWLQLMADAPNETHVGQVSEQSQLHGSWVARSWAVTPVTPSNSTVAAVHGEEGYVPPLYSSHMQFWPWTPGSWSMTTMTPRTTAFRMIAFM